MEQGRLELTLFPREAIMYSTGLTYKLKQDRYPDYKKAHTAFSDVKFLDHS